MFLKRCGYNVTVIAAKGEMVREFEDIGVKFYEFDFHDKSKKNISKIEDIIDEEEITQMHIHPFYPFYSAVVASIKKISRIFYIFMVYL